jgi:predicted permease
MTAQLDILRQDLVYALRQLRRSPGFTAVAVLSLAIGIGANVTIYSGARAFLQRPPDAVRPAELVRVYRGAHSPLPRDWFLHFARNSRTLTDMIAEDPMPLGLERGPGESERVYATVVSENYFRALGVPPALGTVFAGEPGDPVGAVVVLSHAFWTSRLGGDPGIVGRTLRLNAQPFTVVGVAREGFQSSQFGWAPAVFIPLSEQARLRGLAPGALAQSSFYITGRRARGRTPEQVEAELLGLAATLPDAPLELTQPGAFRVERARGITAEVRTPAAVVSAFLMAVVGLVLLIACANLANLLLARATVRRREVAIRLALGVSRARLVRQLLTESVVVALVGGAAGFGVAAYLTRLLPRLLPDVPEVAFDLSPDGRVLLFAAVLAVVTGLVFGLLPALQASRTDIQGVLKADSPGSGSRRSRLRSAFLVAQVSLATVLLVAAALFLRGLGNAAGIDPGFRSARVADLPIDLSLRQYDDERGRVYYRELLERVRGLAGVEAAALIGFVPLSGSNSGTGVAPATADPTDRSAFRGTTFTPVAPGYFAMFGIPIIRGRAFEDGDREGVPAVAIANESFARMMWPDAEAVGQRALFGGDDVVTIVGVVPDTKYKSLGDQNEPFLYLPSTQWYQGAMVLQVRLANDTPAERVAIRRTVQALDPGLPLPAITTMAHDMGISLLPARLGAGLLGAFGGLALLLASLGVYGVTAYLVGQRTAEIGIRTALGASAGNVLALVMRDTVRLVAIGSALGLAGGIGVGRIASGWLYGVGALDPLALGGAVAVLLAVALLGTWLPARRALAVDPIRALRSE